MAPTAVATTPRPSRSAVSGHDSSEGRRAAMVVTREIPPPQWRRVLDDLSRVHDGADVRLVVLDQEHGLQAHGQAFRLAGLTSDGEPGFESISAILAGS